MNDFAIIYLLAFLFVFIMLHQFVVAPSKEEIRVMAFRQCLNTPGATEAVCKEVINSEVLKSSK